jgi:cytochrome c2
MGRVHLFGAAAILLAAACGERASTSATTSAPPATTTVEAPKTPVRTYLGWTDAEPKGDAARGKELVAKMECGRCHEGTGLATPGIQESCTGCHQKIQAGTYPASHEKLARWQKNIVHYNAVPTLEQVGERLRASWIASFLQEPRKTRPHVEEWMPRMPIEKKDAEDIAAYLTRSARPAAEVALGDVEKGRAVVESKGCLTCHAFTGTSGLAVSAPNVAPEAMIAGLREAPDLALARDRFRPDVLAKWIRSPKSIKADTTMPELGLTEEEARDAAAFLVSVPLTPPAATPPIEKLPLLDRKVAFGEVLEKVFDKTCTHCHSDPNTRGLGGPGSTGGFGFKARGVQLTSWDGTRAGYIDHAAGGRKSLLDGPVIKVGTSETKSRLVAALLARHEEVAGRPVPGVRGMPMGLPPLSREDIQLVETWVSLGGPR